MKHRRFWAIAVLSVIFFSTLALVPHMEIRALSPFANFVSNGVACDSLTSDNVESECVFSKIKTSPFSLKKGKSDFLIPSENAHILIQSAFSISLKNADSPTDKLIENINSRAP